jgi:hypothetical protein
MKRLLGTDEGSNSFIMSIGVVKNNSDPAQHGRLQIYIPAIDSKSYDLDDLTWADYVTPFGGAVANLKVGREQSEIPGMSAYGFWAIPKIGAQVICGYMESDPSMRFWFGCIYTPEVNRTLPQSIDGGLTELDDSGVYPQKEIPHLAANLAEAGLDKSSKHYRTRGGYERSVSHPSNKTNNKPTDNGYAPKPNEPDKADSQIICLSSPGKHYIMMSDVDEYCRVRIKTTEGNQIIFDDTNERIYISTAKGKNWIELDEGNGRVYLYSDSKINIRAKNDLNLYSDENVNIVANKRVNIQSETRSVNIESVHDVRLNSTAADVLVTASRDIQLKTTGGPCAGGVGEEQFCDGDKGFVYRWAEKGGSGSSSIKIDASDALDLSSKGGLSLGAKGGMNIRSGGSSPVFLQTGGDLHIKVAETFHVKSKNGTSNPGSASMASSADGAASVTSMNVGARMVKPDHESWDRDEDESKCKTPRNSKYQG